MKHIFFLAFIFSMIVLFTIEANSQNRIERGNLVLENIPDEVPIEIKNRLQQYQNTRGAAFRDWTQDGGMLIGTRFGETAQVHYVAKPKGARQQITFFDNAAMGASVNPADSENGFIFRMDADGNENFQLYYFDKISGKVQLLTDGKHRFSGGYWDNNGEYFYYNGTPRNGRDYDIFRASLKNPEDIEVIFEGSGYWGGGDISPDNNYKLIFNYLSANESYYYILNLNTNEKVQINPDSEKTAYGTAMFSHDNQGLFIVSDQNHEFRTLHYYSITEKEMVPISHNIPWDVTAFDISHDGKKLAFVTNENGFSVLYTLDTRTKRFRKNENIPPGIITSMKFHPNKLNLAMTINTPTSPSEVYVLDYKKKETVQWTIGEVGGLDTETFVIPEIITYPTFDKVDGKTREIPAILYKPKGEGPFPVLIDIHGGPESQARPYFNPITQFTLNELGIAVIYPNVRGSSGFGKTYLTLDNWEKREDAVKDIGKLIDWIDSQSDLDNNRIAVTGGSYGGYMSLASLIHFNDRLKAGICIVGITNFVTFLENTESYRRDLRRVEYGDERIPEMRAFLEEISPLTRADEIKSPLFIAHGLNDPRVPASEAEQMVSAVNENNGNVWFMLAKDEGHSFRRKSNRDFFTELRTMFLIEYLLNE